ncbi:hypothetical protein [Shewanella gaetbuli]|uniref:Uncharacterized protein n=1 Tax=Shewanella gaetbuli TaxID=220752 RepID=A0A9X2CL97_9GAMM|nr:hypothetical protein [Shewanella gaetbuli]MCL1142489.1 hypothetical protein [Shewanella gaetbuli]
MSLEQLYDSIEYVTIIGNAEGDWALAPAGKTITFNTTYHEDAIHIRADHLSAPNKPLSVENTEHNGLFEEVLNTVAQSLEKRVNCAPSIGLVTAVMTAMVSKSVKLRRMTLLPNLAQIESTDELKRQRCLKYNWLGERRIALGIALTHPHMNWPDLYLKPKIDFTVTPHKDLNPFELLVGDIFGIEQNALDLARIQHQSTMPTDYQKQVNTLKTLANLDTQYWLATSNKDYLLECEGFFYNKQNDNGSHWYLKDFKASQYIDDIRHHLAYCQQILAFKALTV